jgi:acyl carrier protein phosphodiesterase
MNHLAHLLLAERSDGLLVGGFLGDFVKGRLKGDRPTVIEQGIKLHRYIDHFTDHHPEALGLRALFPDSTRKIAGIALDLMFDHQLALEFTKWHPDALEVFERRVFARLLAKEHAPYFPSAALAQCQAMSARLSSCQRALWG